jgi:hypothetical protein
MLHERSIRLREFRIKHVEGRFVEIEWFGQAELHSAVARVGAHVLPVPGMTTDEVAGPAHLPALRPIGRPGIMVRFSPPESAITATAPAGLRDPQADSLGRILGTRPRIMAGTTAGVTAPHRGFEGLGDQRSHT